ncbi:MAG TPA: hypothetical protein VLF94_04090 [Chlamydiales bacterium]|nr:hypothetical protein [Chlamydiales bacterium]
MSTYVNAGSLGGLIVGLFWEGSKVVQDPPPRMYEVIASLGAWTVTGATAGLLIDSGVHAMSEISPFLPGRVVVPLSQYVNVDYLALPCIFLAGYFAASLCRRPRG